MRVTLSAANAHVESGEAVSLKVSLRRRRADCPMASTSAQGLVRPARSDGLCHRQDRAARGAGKPPWDLRVWASIDRLRSLVTARIRAGLPGERGEIAAALITGERAGISEEDNQAMRDSGLFHILSISGLHMVIMAGTVFWLIRAGLALHPVDCAALSNPQMGGGRCARRGLVLSALVRRRRADRPFLDHDEYRAHCRAARPAGAHHAQRCARRAPYPHRVA